MIRKKVEKPEKILTLHPDPGKAGVNIDKAKYDQIKKAVLEVLKSQEPMTPSELFDAMTAKLEGKFDGRIGWYTMSLKLDLEARGVIAHDRKTRQITLS